MATTTVTQKSSAENPQRLAWATMLFGLAVFILLCIGTIAFAQWLIFESPTTMNVTLRVGQGTVGVQAPDSTDERAVRSSAEIKRNERLTTDKLSQGYLAFSDPYSGDIVATVTLRNDSGATLGKAERPRFSISDNAYSIRIDNVAGNAEVWINDGLERRISLDITTPLGAVHLEEKGNVLIDTTLDMMTVIARDGTALVTNASRNSRVITQSLEAIIRRDSEDIITAQGPIDLLPYSTFGTAWPKEWICAHQPDPGFPNAPSGDFEYGTADGRSTIHLWRENSGPTPAKTGCFQRLSSNGDGLNVMQYKSLHLRVTILVHHQSLSACGIAGSECPVMLKMTYLDQFGNQRVWYHGFYTEFRPNEESRRTCDSCWEPHEQINKDAWYTYESGDLLNDWPEDLRPGAIKEIEFYASGHEYNVMLNEVAMIATLPDDARTSPTTP